MFYRLKTDFRLSIITLLATSGLLGITPFAVMRFLQGNILAGVVDLIIMLFITACMVYAWASGDTARSGFFMAVVACAGAVTAGAVVGEAGLFWLYPCLVTSFFLTEPRYAIFINMAAVVALMVHGVAFSSTVQMWSFAATAVVVSCCALAFAHRNEDQRERLAHLATIDPLTGVKNRRSMDEELSVATASAARTGISYGLVLLDIDHFKKVNDAHGHSVGDEVLKDLVALIGQNIRKSDQLFRFGGEEFVLLMSGVDQAGLRAVMHNLQQIMHKFLKHPGGKVTASFGVALLKNGEAPEDWLVRADEALYKAKSSGRDQIVYAEEVDSGETAAEPA
ncbi:GGDEF domain-containing protein [Marinobacter orientalis]|uniref:diguanylate cyclase n=1 Tax=Marinobacter orientalis TaxID=1928859 RepID=A0A7Y0NK91_9GAMM|nr:GGDEF domain-containing protein [Marinobacter orientalis]NMT62951.1 GGDEF domain-containing protein [Marinobacter orientalis]TGX52076.1 GGDEF domain-containing protein [Marinobacter orientalis]